MKSVHSKIVTRQSSKVEPFCFYSEDRPGSSALSLCRSESSAESSDTVWISALIQPSIVLYASWNAVSTAECGDLTAAGSEILQCATTGEFVHSGQVSDAALSQTVMTISIFGALSPANSSQLLERISVVE